MCHNNYCKVNVFVFFLPPVCVHVCVHVRSDAAETVIHSADAFAPVGYLRFTEMHTQSKDGVSQLLLQGIYTLDFSAAEF